MCAGAPGTLVGASADLAFVEEDAVLVISTDAGIVATSLDGTKRRTSFEEDAQIEGTSVDYATWVRLDSETNLLIGDLATGEWRRVPELDGIASDAAVSPDGSRVIASRHSDFDVPNSPNEDTLYVIDTESLAVRTIPKSSEHWPTSLVWTRDGTSVLIRMAFEGSPQLVDVSTGERRAVDDVGAVAVFQNPAKIRGECEGRIDHQDFDDEVTVHYSGGRDVVVARVEGRKRGFHDHASSFGTPVLTPDCDYVVFNWGRRIWIADADGSGKNGPPQQGVFMFFASPSLLDPA